MDYKLDAKIKLVTQETKLRLGDLLHNYNRVIKKIVHYEIVEVNNESVRIMLMALNGLPIKRDERQLVDFKITTLVKREFYIQVDKSNDRDFWPKSIEKAIEKLMFQYSNDELRNIKTMDWIEFNNRYNSIGGIALWIRNYFGLYRGNYDLLLDCDTEEADADNVSSIIVYKLWEKIKDYSFD